MAFHGCKDFLVRLKLTNKVAAASKIKAEGMLVGKKSDKANIKKKILGVRTDFVTDGLNFISNLLDGILHQSVLNSDLTKGLAVFDPFI